MFPASLLLQASSSRKIHYLIIHVFHHRVGSLAVAYPLRHSFILSFVQLDYVKKNLVFF